MSVIDADAAFEEMSPGLRHDTLADRCKIDGCLNPRAWKAGMYGGLCQEHGDAKKATKKNGAGFSRVALPPPLPAVVTISLPSRDALELELRDLEESAGVVRELLAALDAYAAR